VRSWRRCLRGGKRAVWVFPQKRVDVDPFCFTWFFYLKRYTYFTYKN
jgi:hypothetical protein